MVNGRFLHIGVACTDLDREARGLSSIGYSRVGDEFLDPIQGIRGLFLDGAGPRLELVCPTGPGGVLQPWLDRGAKMYHLAFEVDDLELELRRLAEARGREVVAPVPAVAFEDRKIAFVMLPTMMLVELIQGHHE